MSDKKSCYNCLHLNANNDPDGDGRGPFCTKKSCRSLSSWSRNPRMWLSIPPTESGRYWFKNELMKLVCMKLFLDPTTGKILDEFNDADISKWDGEWQGPITPEG